MVAARARHIPQLLDIHAEDLAFLWSQRREALTSRKHTLRELGELNERIEAHLQGLLIAAPADLAAMMQPRLGAPDRDDAFAAAYALLRLAEAGSTYAVVAAFTRASGATLAGLRDALGFAPQALFAAEMQSALDQAKPVTAVAAAVVLANHRLLDRHSARLALLLEDAEPAVCELAWRAATVADASAKSLAEAAARHADRHAESTAAREAAPKRQFKHALAHVAPAVRSAGWAAAAWSGQLRAMPLLRQVAVSGDAVALHWLSVLGGDEDAPLLQKAALEMADPAARCALLARYGHPSALNALVRWMDPADVPLAAAAGEAFTRITGVDIRGQRTTLPVPDDADDFSRDMAPDVWLPDAAKAKALMEREGSTWSADHRWCMGVPVDGEVDRAALIPMDFEARWDVAARGALNGQAVSAPAPIH